MTPKRSCGQLVVHTFTTLRKDYSNITRISYFLAERTADTRRAEWFRAAKESSSEYLINVYVLIGHWKYFFIAWWIYRPPVVHTDVLEVCGVVAYLNPLSTAGRRTAVFCTWVSICLGKKRPRLNQSFFLQLKASMSVSGAIASCCATYGENLRKKPRARVCVCMGDSWHGQTGRPPGAASDER